MARIPETCAPVNARTLFQAELDEAVQSLCQTISARLNALLVATANHLVGRGHYVRRSKVSKRLRGEGKCCRCGSGRSRRFSRNGFRHREPLVTSWGEVPLEVPRVRCECGGSVKIDFGGLIRPYQRISNSVSSFHHHSKAVTAMSPLQFQKQIRLQEARRLMLGEDLDTASAGYRVGYNDAWHFNREYKRLLGLPPLRDVERLRKATRGSTFG
jgi:predicted nucleic acid-binding Zn ribbon protein